MAHNIGTTRDGRAAFVSLREPAWHGLGTILEKPVTDEEWMKLAGLDWRVNKIGLYTKDMDVVTSHMAIVREDTKALLGIVSKNYEPVQNQELMDWLRGLDGFADVTIETAASLGSGETVFISARCNGLCFSIGGDEHKGYMVVSNGHVGNRRLMITPTMTRVVCANTLAMATGVVEGAAARKDANTGHALKGNLTRGFALRHTKNVKEMMSNIQEAYARTTKAWKDTEEIMRAFALKPLTEEMLTTLIVEPFKEAKTENKDAEALAALLGDGPTVDESKDEGVVASAAAQAREKRIREIHESETCRRYDSTSGTLFSAFNAVTEFITHELVVKTGDDDTKGTKARFASNLMDRGDRIKRKAFNTALELLNA